MNIPARAIPVFGGLAAVLVLATAIAALLPNSPSIQNVRARIRAWWVMIACGTAIFSGGPSAIHALFVTASLVCTYEFLRTRRQPRDFALAAIIAMGILSVPHDPLPALFLVLTVQASDVLQFLWGKLAGRHSLAPTISPGRTVEGLVGGILSAAALGAALHSLTPYAAERAALLTLITTLAGVGGGLILSARKRERGIKDWGNWIAGHGGLLDRMDSIWLSAPVFQLIVTTRILDG